MNLSLMSLEIAVVGLGWVYLKGAPHEWTQPSITLLNAASGAVLKQTKINARRTQNAPTTNATTDQFVTSPTTTTGTPARTAMP